MMTPFEKHVERRRIRKYSNQVQREMYALGWRPFQSGIDHIKVVGDPFKPQ